MAIERRAHATWEGDLRSGAGRFDLESSGAVRGQEVTFASRFEDEADGKTSPEELIAAAHATCLSMALSHGLAQDGHAPERLDTSATVTFNWTSGTGVTQYWLWIGTSPGGSDRYTQSQGTNLSATVVGLPAAVTVYVRLWSQFGTVWQFLDYVYGPGAGAGERYPASADRGGFVE